MNSKRVACPCPKCREPYSKVLRSASEPGGEIVRFRLCPACEHRWYTAQEPEYIIPISRMKWLRTGPVVIPAD